MAGPPTDDDDALINQSRRGSAPGGVVATPTPAQTAPAPGIDDDAIINQARGGVIPDQPHQVPLQVAPVPQPPPDLSRHPFLSPVEDGLKMDYRAAKMLKPAMDEFRAGGGHIQFEGPLGAFRTTAEQASPNIQGQPYHAAPGSSWHEQGLAADLSGDVSKFAATARKYGFEQSVPGDVGHFTYQPLVTGGEAVWSPDQLAAFRKAHATTPVQRAVESQGQELGYSNSAISVFVRQIKQESGFDPKAVSSAGAVGAPQFMPATLAGVLPRTGYTNSEYLNDKSGSVQIHAFYTHMNDLLQQSKGDVAYALAAYNGGPGVAAAVRHGGHLPPETRDYVSNILQTSPQQAEAWLRNGGGPQLPPPDPFQRSQVARSNLGRGLQAAATTLLPKSAQPDDAIAALDTAPFSKDLEHFGRQMAYGGLAGLHGLYDYATKEMPFTNGVVPQIPGVSVPGQLKMGDLPGQDFRQGISDAMGRLADSVKPTDQWGPEQQQLNREMGGHDGAGEYAWYAATQAMHGNFRPIADPNALSAAAQSVVLNEAGPMAGYALFSGILGKMVAPGAGAVPGPAAPALAGALAKGPMGRMGQVLGGGFVKDFIAAQGPGALQMGALAFGQAIHEGKSEQEAAVDGVTQAAAAVVMAGLLHVGLKTAKAGIGMLQGGSPPPGAPEAPQPSMPLQTSPVGPQAPGPAPPAAMGPAYQSALQAPTAAPMSAYQSPPMQAYQSAPAPAYQSGLQPVQGSLQGPPGGAPPPAPPLPQPGTPQITAAVTAGMQPIIPQLQDYFGDKNNVWNLKVRPSIDAVAKALDGKMGGRAGQFTQAVKETFQEFQQLQMFAHERNTNDANIAAFTARGTALSATADQVEQWMGGVKQAVQMAQQQADLAGQWLKHFTQVSDPALAINPNFQEAVNYQQQITADPSTANAPTAGPGSKSLNTLLKAALKQLAPADHPKVAAFADKALLQATKLTELKQNQDRLPPDLEASLGRDLGVVRGLADYTMKWAGVLQTSFVPPDTEAILRLTPTGAPPATEAAYQAIVDNYVGAVQQFSSNRLGPISVGPSTLFDAAGTTLRSLLDTLNKTGDPAARASHIVDDFEMQHQQLLAREPEKPSPPSSASLQNTQDKRIKTGKYTQQYQDYENVALPQWKAEHAQWEQEKATSQAALDRAKGILGKEDLVAGTPAGGYTGLLRSSASVPEAVRTEVTDDMKADLNVHLQSLGVTGGLDQLEKFYSPEKLNAGQVFRRLWEANPSLKKLGSADWSKMPAQLQAGVLKKEFGAGGPGGKVDQPWVKVQVPMDWVSPPSPKQATMDEFERSAKAGLGKEKESGIGKGLITRPALLGEASPGADGAPQFKIIDGNGRIQKLQDQGQNLVTAHIREDRWNQMLADRLGSVHDQLADARGDSTQMTLAAGHVLKLWNYLNAQNTQLGTNPVNAAGEMNSRVLASAEKYFSGLSPEEMQQHVDNQWTRIASAFANTANPSEMQASQLANFPDQQTQPADWTHQLPSALQDELSRNVGLSAATRNLIQWARPQTVEEAIGRATNCFEDWHHKQVATRELVTQTAKVVGDKLDEALKAISMTREGGRLSNAPGELFGEKTVDALQSLTQGPQDMYAYLREYPPMRDVFAAHFGIMSVAEKYKLSSPDLENMFNTIALPQRFPELGMRMKQIIQRDPEKAALLTSLFSEKARQIPTLKAARAIYAEAQSKLLSNENWKEIPNLKTGGTMDGTTPEEKINRFWQMDSREQAVLIPSKKDASNMLIHLGLNNPVTDPAEMVKIHLGAMLGAENNRVLLAHLASTPVPGMSTPKGSRPYNLLEHYGPNDTPASMPSLKGGKDSTYVSSPELAQERNAPVGTTLRKPVSLTRLGFNQNDSVRVGGELFSAKEELYLHPDVAETFLKWFHDPEIAEGQFRSINEMTRTASLALGAPVHLLRIMAAHAAGEAGYSMRSLVSSIWKRDLAGTAGAATDFITSPLAGVRNAVVGRNMSTMMELRMDSMLHGLNTKLLDQATRGQVQEAQKIYAQQSGMTVASPTSPQGPGVMASLGEATDSARRADFSGAFGAVGDAWRQGSAQVQQLGAEVTQHKPPGQAWDEARTANTFGGKVKAMTNAGINMGRAWEQISTFQVMEHAALGAYSQWVDRYWKDIGPQLVAKGMPEDAALRECKVAAANMVNQISGSLMPYKTPNAAKNALYTSLLGQFMSSPQYFRTKMEGLAVLPGMVDRNYSPEMQRYMATQRAAAVPILLTAGLAANRFWHALSAYPQDPSDQSGTLRRVGDRVTFGPASGYMQTYANQFLNKDQPHAAAALNALYNQVQGPLQGIVDVVRNRDFSGQPVYNDEQGQSTADKLKADWAIGAHIAGKTLNLQPVIGLADPSKSLVQKAQGFLGTQEDNPRPDYSVEREAQKTLAYPDQSLRHAIQDDMQIYNERDRHGNYAHTEDDRNAARTRMETRTGTEGWPLTTPEQKVWGSPTRTWDAGKLQEEINKSDAIWQGRVRAYQNRRTQDAIQKLAQP